LSNTEYILDWTKSSQNTNIGLFGMDANINKLEFKNPKQTPTMEKLMMEQEVFKSFVSANPLD
jgi:hypothetical protein